MKEMKPEKYRGKLITFRKEKYKCEIDGYNYTNVIAQWDTGEYIGEGAGYGGTKESAFRGAKRHIDEELEQHLQSRVVEVPGAIPSIEANTFTCSHCGKPCSFDSEGEEIEGETVCNECAEEWRQGGGCW